MSGQHTPGSWTFTEVYDTDAHRLYLILSDGGGAVAEVYGAPTERRRRLPDARLIAAAPDLLTALTDLVDVTAGIFPAGSPSDQRVTAARAAIAKAKGEAR